MVMIKHRLCSCTMYWPGPVLLLGKTIYVSVLSNYLTVNKFLERAAVEKKKRVSELDSVASLVQREILFPLLSCVFIGFQTSSMHSNHLLLVTQVVAVSYSA